jgi:hypothetical protein
MLKLEPRWQKQENLASAAGPQASVQILNILLILMIKYTWLQYISRWIYHKTKTHCLYLIIRLKIPFQHVFCLKNINVCKSITFFFFDLRKPHFLESVLCRFRWASKTLTVPGSYKRCTSWLELETCCADLKPFGIFFILCVWKWKVYFYF